MTDFFEMKRPRGRPEGTGLGRVTRTLSREELKRFFSAASKVGRKFDLMFSLIFHFALRAGECARIRLDDFKVENRGEGNLLTLTIRALKGGDDNKPEVPEWIERKLKAWLKERNGVEGNPFLFPHRLSTRSAHMTTEAIKAAFRMVARRAGIEGMIRRERESIVFLPRRRGFLPLLDLRARFSRLLTSPSGRGYSSTMDWGANSMPGGGIQPARKKQILIVSLVSLTSWRDIRNNLDKFEFPFPGCYPFPKIHRRERGP